MSDYHLHLHPHFPAPPGSPPPGEYPPGRIEAYVEAAAARGVTEVGFTEHLYRCVEAVPIIGRFWEREARSDLANQVAAFVPTEQDISLERYVATVVEAKRAGLPVKLGLEVDFWPDKIEEILELLAPYPFDYLIGSIHWIGGWSYDFEDVVYEFERRGVARAWEQYFGLETAMAASGTVDVLAHVDYIKKLGYRPDDEPIHLYEMVVEAAAASGTAVEVSSHGLRQPVGEIYPAPKLLEMFRSAGVPITLASDAHEPELAGWGHEAVREAARNAGYSRYLRFEDRKPYDVALNAPSSN